MKRLLTLACVLLGPVLVWSQVTMSVDLGYGNRGYSYLVRGMAAYDGSLPKGQSCYFAPRVGYSFDGYVCIGLQLGIGYSTYDYLEGFYNPDEVEWQQSAEVNNELLNASAKAFMRFRIASVDKIDFHIELSASYSYGWGNETRSELRATDIWDVDMQRRQRVQGFAAQAVPVVSYALGKHVSADFYLNLVALTYSSTTTELWPYSIKNYTISDEPETKTTIQEFTVGVNSLNTNVLTLGVSFIF